MEGPSSPPKCSRSLHSNGDFHIKSQHHVTLRKAKATVKSMKKLIHISWTGRLFNADNFCRALLQYRNTPSCKDDMSPAQKLYRHPVQDILPAHHRPFSKECIWQRKAAEVVEQQVTQSLQSSATCSNIPRNSDWL